MPCWARNASGLSSSTVAIAVLAGGGWTSTVCCGGSDRFNFGLCHNPHRVGISLKLPVIAHHRFVRMEDRYWEAASFCVPDIPPNHATYRDALSFLRREGAVAFAPSKTAIDASSGKRRVGGYRLSSLLLATCEGKMRSSTH
jgi:hypothetical protein